MKITRVDDGPNQGEWADIREGQLSLVTKSNAGKPYVGAHVRDDNGHLTALPYAMSFENGVLMLQFPLPGGHVKIVPMSAMIDAYKYLDDLLQSRKRKDAD